MCITVMTVSEVFTKDVYRTLVPLVFLIFVTNKWFSARAPLDGFRKERISKSDALIIIQVTKLPRLNYYIYSDVINFGGEINLTFCHDKYTIIVTKGGVSCLLWKALKPESMRWMMETS